MAVREREAARSEQKSSSPRLPVSRRDSRSEVEARSVASLPRPAGPERSPSSVPADLVRPSSAGSHLPPARQAALESAFDTDLSAVRVHTGPSADRSARAIGASAYTIGPSIVFADGAYAPTTSAGTALLTHEVAHTVQDPRGTAVHRYDNVCEADEARAPVCEPDPAPEPAQPAEPDPDPDAAAYAAVEGLTDDQLLAQSGDSWADITRGDQTALQSHDLYRYELERRHLSETAPTPSERQFQTADGLVWSTSSVHTRWQVERVYAGQAGVRPNEARDNIRVEVQRIAVANGYNTVAGVPEQGALTQEQQDAVTVAGQIRDLAEQQFTEVQSEVDSFMSTFEPNTQTLAFEILDASDRRIREELVHYGIVMNAPIDDVDDDQDADVDEGGANLGGPGYGFSDTAATSEARAGLQHAAQEIADAETARRAIEARHNEVVGRIMWIEDCADPEALRQDNDFDADVDEGPPSDPVAGYCAAAPSSDEMDLLVDARDALQRQLAQAASQVAELRASRENEFPLLASYTSGEQIDLDGLHRLANDTNANAIASDASTKLANIERVRSKLRSGDLTIWELPDLLAIAQQRAHVASVSPYANAIHERAVAAGGGGFWRSIGITVLSIGLGLIAAIPTGGASLAVTATVLAAEIAGATLDLYLLSQSVSEYRTRDALTNTDYDRARALSHEEPSLLWLAVDIIGNVVGIGGAIRGATHAFRDIVRARRAAIAARNLEELVDQIERMRQAGADIGLGARSAERLELQVLGELPDRQLAEAAAAATTRAATAEEMVARLGRRLTDRVTPHDLGALSRELGLPVTIDPALTQDVRVMTDLIDGRVVRARGIIVGPGATLADIAQHRETIALLGDLERVTTELGAQTDALLGTVVGPNGAINPFPPGSQSFNSWIELRKYPALLQARYARLAEDGITAAERGTLREDIRFFETELAYHSEVVNGSVLERGEDFIARSSASNRAAIDAGYPATFDLPATEGAPARTFTIGEPGSPYYYARAGDGTDRYVIRRYVDAVDAPAVTVTRAADGAVTIAEGGLTRTEAGLALRRSWSQPVQDAFNDAEAALRAQHGSALYRVVPLSGVHALQRTIGSLMTPAQLESLEAILTRSLSRSRSAEAARRLAEDAIRDLSAHPIVIVRGTDQLRAFGYRAHFISESSRVAGTAVSVEGDLHHLIPLYLGGEHGIGNLLDLDELAHRQVHELLEGVEIGEDLTLAPSSIGRMDVNFEAGIGILYRDGSIELQPLSAYMTSEATSAADVAAPVSTSVAQ